MKLLISKLSLLIAEEKEKEGYNTNKKNIKERERSPDYNAPVY